jgi:hypothetical protein
MNHQTWMIVASAASPSLGLPSLQENRDCQTVSSGALHVRCEHARGLLLRRVRELEHVADRESALCRLFLKKHRPGGRVQLWDAPHQDPQSRR